MYRKMILRRCVVNNMAEQKSFCGTMMRIFRLTKSITKLHCKEKKEKKNKNKKGKGLNDGIPISLDENVYQVTD